MVDLKRGKDFNFLKDKLIYNTYFLIYPLCPALAGWKIKLTEVEEKQE